MGMAGVWVVGAECRRKRGGWTAVTCPVRLGREPSAGGTIIFIFPVSAPCGSAVFLLLGFTFEVGFRTCKKRRTCAVVLLGIGPPCSSVFLGC